MFNPKVLNADMPNNIIQMKSGGFQAPFIAGGNQTAFYLGMKGNSGSTPQQPYISAYEKIVEAHKK